MTYLFPKSSLTSIFIPRFYNLFHGMVHKRIQLENSDNYLKNYQNQHSTFNYYCDTMKLNSYFSIIKYYEKNDENRLNPIDFMEASIYVENIDKINNLCYHENIKMIDHSKKENKIFMEYEFIINKNINKNKIYIHNTFDKEQFLDFDLKIFHNKKTMFDIINMKNEIEKMDLKK